MKIGIHEVQRELGRGGMGVVYAVTAPHLPGERALKLLTSGADPDSRARFRREAELLAQVRHPGVVAIHEIGEAEQGLYLVMDLVPGEPLDQVLKRGAASADQARAWILEVADALAALHERDLLHRDLKPANLILRPDGHLVLLDFGLARSAGGSSLTETGGITGSPGFLAPEQARGLKVLTPAVDVHGLGTTLFSFLSGGVPPFRGATILATVAAVLKEEALWPADLPPDLLAVGQRALTKDPSERFPDARAFAAALRQPEPLEAPPPPSPAPLGLFLGALVLILLVTSGAWIAISGGAPSPTPEASARLTPSPVGVVEWPELPRAPGERATWFSASWGRWRAGQEPARIARRDYQRLLRDPLYSLAVRSSESAMARFWGSARWVRWRSKGVDWGLIGAFPVEVEGGFEAQAEGRMSLHAGRALTLYSLGARPRGWRVTTPGAPLTPLRLPPAPSLEGVAFGGQAHSERRLCMFTAARAYELDLERPESWRVAHKLTTPRKHVEALYTPRDELVLATSTQTEGELRFAEGQPRVALEGGPRALGTHPLLPLVAVGDQDGRVQLWSYETGGMERLREQGQTHRVRALVFDPTGRFLYSMAALTPDMARGGDERGQVQVWRSSPEGAWSATRRIELPWTPDYLSLSPDGALLLVSNERGQVLLYAAGDHEGP